MALIKSNLLILIFFFLISCSDSGSSLESSVIPNSPAANGEIINPYVSGSLYFQTSFYEPTPTYRMDLATGNFTRLTASTGWNDLFGGGIKLIVSEPASFERDEVVISSNQCGGSSRDRICIKIQEASGLVANEFIAGNWRAVRFPQLSKNKEDIAFILRDANSNYWLRMHKRSGEYIQEMTIPDEWLFDWLGDGRIVMANDRRFLMYDRNDPPGQVSAIQLGDALSGYIGNFEVGPDGETIAYELINRTDNGLFTSLETLNTRTFEDRTILRTANASDLTRIIFPHWSPDGKWIMVNVGTSDNIFNTGLRLFMYAVSTEAEDVQVVDPYNHTENTPNLVRLLTPFSDASGVPGERWPRHDYFWQP